MAMHIDGTTKSHLNGSLSSCAGGKARHAVCKHRVGEEEGEPLVASSPKLLQGQHGQHKVLIVQEGVCTERAQKSEQAQKQHHSQKCQHRSRDKLLQQSQLQKSAFEGKHGQDEFFIIRDRNSIEVFIWGCQSWCSSPNFAAKLRQI